MEQEEAHNGETQNGSSDTSRLLRRPQPRSTWNVETDHTAPKNGHVGTNGEIPLSTETLPGNKKALDSISLRAFLLGLSLGLNIAATIYALCIESPFWRPSFFLASLSLFHFLEFYVTAAHNTRAADVSAFLLSTNGKAYNAAHTAAFLECILSSMFFPDWQSRASKPAVIALGLAAVVIGQTTRSASMAQAGTNFNHTVQTRRNAGHELVTHGIYSVLRHPSYFGFFWWGIGTQLVLGNALCLVAYAGILWKFFQSRITREEELLVMFFGKEYEDYRSQTHVGIPFIP